MKKYVSYQKLSKKLKKEINRRNRKDWGKTVPVTRVVKSKKVYNRKKADYRDFDDSLPFVLLLHSFTV